MRSIYIAMVACSLAACGSFDDPAIVYDMRVLGAIAEPPEILVPVDPDAFDPLALPVIEVCALIADPGDSRALSYAIEACPANATGRCRSSQPSIMMGSGTVGDPEEAAGPVQLCGTLGPNPVLAEILEASISADSLRGFGAIDIQAQITVWPAGNNVADAIYATKQMRFGTELPAERVANTNPSLASIIVTRAPTGMRGLESVLPLGRCGDIAAAVVAPGETIGLLPIEADGIREDYVVPTFEGGARAFTEIMTYSFFSTEGKWSKAQSGGPRDISGTLPTLDTAWTAPSETDVVGTGLDVTLYVIQRDERGGQSWTQSCVRVVP
jgi:hypothetical protein